MQREIKFRCWDDVNKKITYDHFWIDSDGDVWYDRDPNGVDMSGSRRILPANRLHLMQYTGHKVNNIDLYEYDILRNEKMNDEMDDIEYLVCVFINEWAMFGLLTIEEYHNYLKDGADCLDEFLFWTFPIDDKENEQRRICGDIFSTPELLKSL